MAQQASFIKFKGKIGDLSFYKDRNGYQARTKGGVSASRIASDPNYARTRENMAEFGRAGIASKLLRQSLRMLNSQYTDRNVSGRLSSRLLRVIKSDPDNLRGERVAALGNLQLLRGFEFNMGSPMAATLFESIDISVDRGSGLVTASTLAWSNPKLALAVPQEATHFQLTLVAAAVDFDENDGTTVVAEFDSLPINAPSDAQALEASLPANEERPIFVLAGIGFFQEVNGQNYPLNNGQYNALSIMEVHTA